MAAEELDGALDVGVDEEWEELLGRRHGPSQRWTGGVGVGVEPETAG
jgi:hypothetical protein